MADAGAARLGTAVAWAPGRTERTRRSCTAHLPGRVPPESRSRAACAASHRRHRRPSLRGAGQGAAAWPTEAQFRRRRSMAPLRSCPHPRYGALRPHAWREAPAGSASPPPASPRHREMPGRRFRYRRPRVRRPARDGIQAPPTATAPPEWRVVEPGEHQVPASEQRPTVKPLGPVKPEMVWRPALPWTPRPPRHRSAPSPAPTPPPVPAAPWVSRR